MIVSKDKIRFIVDIVDHCNLNCKGCGHFSPLAPKSFLDIETFETDLRRLNVLLNGEIFCLELMGGEALLHPQLEDFLRITAKYVSGEKNLCTNGVLLSTLPNRIYQLCAQTGITICVTMYPIDIDWVEIYRKADLFGTKIFQIKSAGEEEKKWYKNPKDMNGNQNAEDNFMHCFWKARCIVLEQGRVSSCVVPFKAKFFQKYFKSNAFDTTEQNSIDIYKANDIDEIVEFLNKPIPCCRYCLPNKEEQIQCCLLYTSPSPRDA